MVIDIEGYIKLYRKLLDNPIFQNEKLLKVFIWCLLKATHKEHEQLIGLQKIQLQPGQFVYGRFKCSEELKIAPGTLDRLMRWLENEKILSIKSNNKFSVITIEKWELYQLDEIETSNKTDNKRATNEQQMSTNKNVKNDKNKDIEVLHTSLSTEVDPTDKIPYQDIVNMYHSICTSYPKLKTIGDNRKKAISARWKQYKKDILVFETLFQKAEKSEFLKGANNRNWQADFNWLMNDANMAKVLEGKYDKKLSPNNSQPITEHKETAYERAKRESFEMLKKEGIFDE